MLLKGVHQLARVDSKTAASKPLKEKRQAKKAKAARSGSSLMRTPTNE
jgi:hypothetical protein